MQLFRQIIPANTNPKPRDAFNKREKANEDMYMKNKEKEKYV